MPHQSLTKTISEKKLQAFLDKAIEDAKENTEGKIASYIPELASVDPEYLGAVIHTLDGKVVAAGSDTKQLFTLQSAAKLVVLIALLEEMGHQKVLSWVRVEPSGDDFASVARLDQFGPLPSNPMLNSGAITLCSKIPGKPEEIFDWLERWTEICFGERLSINSKVFASERRTGDRNRSLTYLLKSTGMVSGDVDSILETYFYLCSFEANLHQVAHLGQLLANNGKNTEDEQIISKETVQTVVAIMATCGLYNESGSHMVRTGMPAKSSVSGFIAAVVPGVAGIAALSPRVNRKGTSVRSELLLESISQSCQWHFAVS